MIAPISNTYRISTFRGKAFGQTNVNLLFGAHYDKITGALADVYALRARQIELLAGDHKHTARVVCGVMSYKLGLWQNEESVW
jgi:hypothetical protein